MVALHEGVMYGRAGPRAGLCACDRVSRVHVGGVRPLRRQCVAPVASDRSNSEREMVAERKEALTREASMRATSSRRTWSKRMRSSCAPARVTSRVEGGGGAQCHIIACHNGRDGGQPRAEEVDGGEGCAGEYRRRREEDPWGAGGGERLPAAEGGGGRGVGSSIPRLYPPRLYRGLVCRW